MAWRIHEHVLRGEIDNCVRDRITGRIWLAGMAEPLVLDLTGNAQPDLAGCRLYFENPSPLPIKTSLPTTQQRGQAGLMSAARKVRVFDTPLEDVDALLEGGGTPPEHLANSLYLSWFSERNGEVIIESPDYRLEISEPSWSYTVAEFAELARLAAELEDAPFAIRLDADGDCEEWDEFRCEQLLRESDFTTEQYAKLLKKYADHPNGERLIAEKMGWTEPPNLDPPSADPLEETTPDFSGPEPDPAREGVDWMRNQRGDVVHPLHHRANELLHTLLDETRPQFFDLRSILMQLSAKLAGALNSIARNPEILDRGMTVARLKRVLAILHQAFPAVPISPLPPARQTHYRSELFALREEILALIACLRNRE